VHKKTSHAKPHDFTQGAKRQAHLEMCDCTRGPKRQAHVELCDSTQDAVHIKPCCQASRILHQAQENKLIQNLATILHRVQKTTSSYKTVQFCIRAQ
jgi:hypothetical protein